MASLTATYSEPVVRENRTGYRLRIVTTGTDMPSAVFVFHSRFTDVDDARDALGDPFSHVATPADLEDFPEDEPDLENNMPFYRSDTLELDFRSIEVMEGVRDWIRQDLADLAASYNTMADLDETVSETYS
jgi:hypothetical protein